MRRIILFLLVLLLIPFNVRALELVPSVEKVWITGVNEKTVGEELSLGFGVKVSGIQKGNVDSLGIVAVSYELIFDDTVFTVTDITSSDWDSVIYEDDGRYYVLSTVSENDPFKNKCVDGISFCADYMVSIKFYVNDTDKSSSNIKMESVTLGLMEMLDLNEEFSEDDVKILETVAVDSYRINIKKTEIAIEDKPSSIVSDTKPTTKTEEIINKKQESVSVKKSDNNNLKELEINGYEIKFDKDKTDYKIEVEKGVNKLKFNVKVDDSKASYKIIGADDLEKNNYKVLIEVSAENGSKKTYTVNVEILEDATLVEEDNKPLLDDEKNNKIKFTKKHFIIGGICLGILLLFIIILKIISYKNDKKLERNLDLL